MKWLLIAIFCFSSASAALLGSNPCTWGPAYWCQNLQNVKKCNAMSHCVKVWKAQPSSSVSSTETCLICKGVVEDLKTMIANKKTQEEIKELAQKVCDLMKNEKTAYEVCNTVVVVYLPEVLKMIESDIDSGTICKMLHLCDASKLVNKFQRLTQVLQKAKSIKTSSNCDECKLGVTMLKSYLSDNATQQELIQYVEQKVCPMLPGDLKTLCTAFVQNEMPEVFKSLEQILDPDTICAMLGLCPKTSHKSLVRSLIVKMMKKQVRKFRASGVECQLCQAGISDIRNTLKDASIQKQIEAFLKTEVCTHLGSLEITCQQGVAQYLPLAMKLIIQDLDPVALCKELKFCAVSRQPVMKLSPAKVTRAKMPRASPQCVVCEFVMTKVDALIGTNKSEAAITSALEKVCDLLPQTVRAECDNFVATYAPQVIKILVSEISPSRTCALLGLCAGEAERVQKYNPDTCNLMVRYLHVLAKELHMSLEDVVHKVCNFLPRMDRPACRSFVSEHKHRILRMKKHDFVVKFHPAHMCQKLQGRRRPTGLVQLLGRSKCTYGPAYWCASYANAKKCGAVKHCHQHVWSRSGGLL